MTEAGVHSLEVSICAADVHGNICEALFQAEKCVTLRPRAAPPAKSLPRLAQKDSLVLCGVDVPTEVSDGTMRVFVALKRVWHDAPREVALVVRDHCPNGERRAARVVRALGTDAEAIGIEVPMSEAGRHNVEVQVCKLLGEEGMEELFTVTGREVLVHAPMAPPPVECRGVSLSGVDLPTHTSNCMLRAIVAVKRASPSAPSALRLIVRDELPNGERRAAVVAKDFSQIDEGTLALEVACGEAGMHIVTLEVAEEVEGQLQLLFVVPGRKVEVTNPPMPRIGEHPDSVVLCGIDVNGGRFPDLVPQPVTDGALRVILAFSRTWDDAPVDFALIVRALAPGGEARSTAVRKNVSSFDPVTIGLTAPMVDAGVHVLEVSLAREEAGGRLVSLFTLPEVAVTVDRSAAPAIDVAAPARVAAEDTAEEDDDVVLVEREAVSYEVVGLKVAMGAAVMRRLSVPVPIDQARFPIGGYDVVEAAVCQAFASDLRVGNAVNLRYCDGDGDHVTMSCDEELGEAMRQRPHSSATIRLTLAQ